MVLLTILIYPTYIDWVDSVFVSFTLMAIFHRILKHKITECDSGKSYDLINLTKTLKTHKTRFCSTLILFSRK